MNHKFNMSLEGDYLTVRINLPGYGVTAIDSVQIGEDPFANMEGPLRLIIEVCGEMRPESTETAIVPESSQGGHPNAQR